MKKDITLKEIQKIVQDQSAIKVIHGLLDKGLIHVYEHANDAYFPKLESYVFLTKTFSQEEKQKELLSQLEKAPKQLQVFLQFLHKYYQEGKVSKKELLALAQADSQALQQLVKKGVLEIQQLQTDRIQYEYEGSLLQNELNILQQKALLEIGQGFAENKPVLLKGITGSGKTHIYLELIKQCLAEGKQCLYLLPEIALTAQSIRKLRSYFGNQVGVYHSKFSNAERVELWRKVLTKEYHIVIGARSALMLPYGSLGLIIVDEEHDSSYKQQDPAPRYHARDAALMLANQMDAKIILGSATPSLESYYNAEQKKYHLVNLTSRYGESELPVIQLVNRKEESVNKTAPPMFSAALLEQMDKSLSQKKQVILFQNRRGYAPFILCKQCGWIPHCKYCDVSLTYHKQTDQLHCHYCGSKSPHIKICLACGSNKMTTSSFGTEKIEEEVKKLFPKANVQRFDWDVMRTKNKHQEIIRQFEKHQIDILVGTQMLVKGLDFDKVNLVGVLSADGMLSYPDFRVNEKVFQMLEQVSGRAGRKKDPGLVFIQLYNVQHPVIQFVKNHDYNSFYKFELASRKEFHYPPFTRLIKIYLKHKNQQRVYEAAQQLFETIKHLPNTLFFGPAEPSIARVKNYYIQELLLKTTKDNQHLIRIKTEIKEKIAILQLSKGFSNVQTILDIDPM